MEAKLRVDCAAQSVALRDAASLLGAGRALPHIVRVQAQLFGTVVPSDSPEQLLLCDVERVVCMTPPPLHSASTRLRTLVDCEHASLASAVGLGARWPLVTLPSANPVLPQSLRTLKGHLDVAAVCTAGCPGSVQQRAAATLFHAQVGPRLE